MASPAEPSLRARLDTLLREAGVAASKGSMLEDAQTVAAAVGVNFSSIRAVIEQAEEALLGSAVAAALAQAPSRERSLETPPRLSEAPSEPQSKRRRSGTGGGPQDAAEDATAPAPARNAFSLFCAERRAEVARRLRVPAGSEGCEEVDEALAEAWRSLEPPSKEDYNACAAVEKQRCALEQLRRGVRSESHAPRIARRVREAIAIMANAPKTARASGLFEGIIKALEDLDRRMGPRVRVKLGAHLGQSIISKEAQAIARRVFGQLNGTRLAMLLRRWCDPQEQAGVPAEQTPRPARLSKPGAVVGVRAPGPTNDETRGKVSEFLARIFSKCSAHSAADLSQEIERELFELTGTDPKEYRNRARALTFNLGVADGVLCGRVVGGELAPAELVRLTAEELACDALKAERDEERRKYFQSEVLVTERVPKRRREILQGPPRGRAAERAEDGEPEDEAASQNQEFGMAESEAGAAEGEVAAPVPAALTDAAGVAPALTEAFAAEMAEEEPGRPRELAPPTPPDSPGATPGPRLWRARSFSEAGVSAEAEAVAAESEAEAEAEDAALRLLEDTSNDDAIAQLLQMMPPSPSSSSSSGSSSDSDSEPAVWAEARSPGASHSQAAASQPAASSSSSSSPAPGAPAGLDHVLAMGFERGAAEAALVHARGSVEAAVALLCAGGGP